MVRTGLEVYREKFNDSKLTPFRLEILKLPLSALNKCLALWLCLGLPFDKLKVCEYMLV
jgi:hypothetical protein